MTYAAIFRMIGRPESVLASVDQDLEENDCGARPETREERQHSLQN